MAEERKQKEWNREMELQKLDQHGLREVAEAWEKVCKAESEFFSKMLSRLIQIDSRLNTLDSAVRGLMGAINARK